MSANLTILLNAGFVRMERYGRTIRFFNNFEALRGLLTFLLEGCCNDNREICQPVIDEITCG